MKKGTHQELEQTEHVAGLSHALSLPLTPEAETMPWPLTDQLQLLVETGFLEGSSRGHIGLATNPTPGHRHIGCAPPPARERKPVVKNAVGACAVPRLRWNPVARANLARTVPKASKTALTPQTWSRPVPPSSSHRPPQPLFTYPSLRCPRGLTTHTTTRKHVNSLRLRADPAEKKEHTRPCRAFIAMLTFVTSSRTTHACTNQKRPWWAAPLWRREAGPERL